MSEINYLIVNNLPARTIENFFAKVEIDQKSGCWLWTGCKSRGYGQFQFKGKTEYAHRFAYAWLIEPLKRGNDKKTLQLDHVVCDTRHCVNPWHTKLVTPKENILRGNGIAPKLAKRNKCYNGHILKPHKVHGRCCPICMTAYQKKYYLTRKLTATLKQC